MAIREYEKDGKTLYEVTYNARSKKIPNLRRQPSRKGIDSLPKAKRIEQELIRATEREIAHLETAGLTWEQLINDFHEYCEEQNKRGFPVMNAETLNDYIASLRKWTGSWLKLRAVSIVAEDVRHMLAEMQNAGKSNDHQFKVKQVVQKVFRFGVETKRLRAEFDNPAMAVKFKRTRTIRRVGLTSEQLKLFLLATKEHEPKWYPLMFMALNTGMRNGELYALEWEDVDLVNKIILVRKSFNSRKNIVKTPKNGEWRNVPINAELEKLLRELKLSSGGRTHVLPRLWMWDQGRQAEMARKLCVMLGFPPIRFHDLRAFFATELMRHGVAPIVVMKIGGWSDLKTMERYIRQAGIEVTGATKALEFLAPAAAMGKVVDLFGTK